MNDGKILTIMETDFRAGETARQFEPGLAIAAGAGDAAAQRSRVFDRLAAQAAQSDLRQFSKRRIFLENRSVPEVRDGSKTDVRGCLINFGFAPRADRRTTFSRTPPSANRPLGCANFLGAPSPFAELRPTADALRPATCRAPTARSSDVNRYAPMAAVAT
jgi:hypothetical protein